METRNESGGSLDCTRSGRAPVSDELRDLVLTRLETTEKCGGTTGINCANFDTCAITELEGESRGACLTQREHMNEDEAGFCYIDPLQNGTSEASEFVSSCPDNARRMLRFVGHDTPANGAATFVVCDSSVL